MGKRRADGTLPAWLAAGRQPLHRLMRNRRGAMAAFGAGAVGLAAASSTVAVLLGDGEAAGRPDDASGAQQVPQKAGSFTNRDASYTAGVGDTNDLGAGGLAATPTAAAQAALAATPRFPTPLTRDPVLHLLRRTTFGPTPDTVSEVKQLGIDAWLDRQLAPDTVSDPGGDAVNRLYPYLGMTIEQLHRSVPENKRNDPSYQLGRATIGRQVWSSRQLQEVMVDFWANHLNIQNPFDGGWDNRTDWDRTVIRKHALGRFSDMLSASARHPAMLRYLDNAASDKRSVNENYGRELLELHTVGIDGGYSETDVRNCAYVMTGRTVDRNGAFAYDAKRHWTGAVTVMGFSHPNKKDGLAVGDQLLAYLATHPSTARYIARKLAVRFVCDTPPAALVERLAAAYLQSGTDTTAVLRVLFRSVEFWIATGLKTRRPLENIVATARVVGLAPGTDTDQALENLYNTSDRLGHAPLAWGPPDGYPDVAAAWQSAHGMLGVWNCHRVMVQGKVRGLSSVPAAQLMAANAAGTAGGYIDAMSQRLVFQPLSAEQKTAVLRFVGQPEQLAPLLLDSVYHGLR